MLDEQQHTPQRYIGPRLLLGAALLSASPALLFAAELPGLTKSPLLTASNTDITLQLSDIKAGASFTLMPGGPYLEQQITSKNPLYAIAATPQQILIASSQPGLSHLVLTESGGKITTMLKAESRLRLVESNSTITLAVSEQNEILLYSLATDTALPVEVGRYSPSETVVKATLEANRAFLITATNKLLVLDLSQLAAPQLITEYSINSTLHAVAAKGGYLYLAADSAGLLVIDINQPGGPQQVARYKTTTPLLDLVLQENTLYLVQGLGGLTTLNIEQPNQPTWLGSHAKLGYASHLYLHKSDVVVTNERNDIFIVDVIDPALPTITSAFRAQQQIRSLRIVDDRAIVAGERGIDIWDISKPQPQLSNENLNVGEGVNFGGQRKGYIDNDILYVADWFSGLHLYDIRQPTNPRLLSSFHTPGSPKGVVVQQGIAYVADDDHGLRLVDVSRPRTPEALSDLPTAGLAYTPLFSDGLLYLASHRGGFQIIDTHNPFAPKLRGEYDTPNKAWSMAVNAATAYVADAESGLLIFDVKNPAHPQLIGQFNPQGNAEDVLIDGTTAYVAFFDKGLYILDVSNPAQPVVLSQLATPGNARGLERVGEALYIADWFAGIHAVNIADKTAPRIIGSYDTAGAAWGVRVKDNYAYVFDWWGGLTVLDVASPAAIHTVGHYNQQTPLHAYAAKGNYLYAAQGVRGLQIFDIKNPLNPTWVTGLELAGNTTDIALGENRLYLATQEGGLAIVAIDNPFAPRLLATLATAEPLEALSVNGRVVYAKERGGDISVIDVADGQQPRVIQRYPANAVEFLIVADSLVAITQEQRLTVYKANPLANETTAIASLSLEGSSPTHLAANGQILYITDNTGNVHIVQLDNGLPKLVAKHALNLVATDLVSDKTTLYVNDVQGGIVTLDMSNVKKPRITNRYPLVSRTTRLLHHRQSLYAAGERTIVALNLLPIPELVNLKDGEVTLHLNENLPAGLYDLLVTGPEGKERRYRNRIEVNQFHLGQGKP